MSYSQQPGNWNDPSWPGQQPVGYPDQAGQPTYQDPAGYPAYQDPAAYPTTGEPLNQDGYGPAYPAYGYPVPAAAPTNGMAVASMVMGIVGVLGLCGYGVGGILGVVGAILGHAARRQIRERGESGDGMALSGIIMGWISTVIAIVATILLIVFFVWLAEQDPSTWENASGVN